MPAITKTVRIKFISLLEYTNMQFDVTVITGNRVGTDSLYRYISHHEKIYCPGYYGTQFRSYGAGHKTLIDFVTCKRNVFIWHDFDTDYIFNGSVPIKPDFLIHPVRHPYDQAVACINASLQQSIIDNKIGTNIRSPHFENFNSNGLSLRAVRHYKQFCKVKVIEFSLLSQSNINKTMNDVYTWLGVDACASFEHDDIFKKTAIDFFIENSPLIVSYKSRKFYFKLCRFNVERHLFVVGSLHSKQFGIVKICLPKSEIYVGGENYRGLTSDLMGELISMAAPEWEETLKWKMNYFDKVKLSRLPLNIMNKIYIDVKRDYCEVVRHYPELDDLWSEKWM